METRRRGMPVSPNTCMSLFGICSLGLLVLVILHFYCFELLEASYSLSADLIGPGTRELRDTIEELMDYADASAKVVYWVPNLMLSTSEPVSMLVFGKDMHYPESCNLVTIIAGRNFEREGEAVLGRMSPLLNESGLGGVITVPMGRYRVVGVTDFTFYETLGVGEKSRRVPLDVILIGFDDAMRWFSQVGIESSRQWNMSADFYLLVRCRSSVARDAFFGELSSTYPSLQLEKYEYDLGVFPTLVARSANVLRIGCLVIMVVAILLSPMHPKASATVIVSCGAGLLVSFLVIVLSQGVVLHRPEYLALLNLDAIAASVAVVVAIVIKLGWNRVHK